MLKAKKSIFKRRIKKLPPARTYALKRRVESILRKKKRRIRIMFICPDGLARSVIEMEGFRQMLKEKGLSNYFSLASNDEFFSRYQYKAHQFDYIVPIFPNLKISEEHLRGYQTKKLLFAVKNGSVEIINNSPITYIGSGSLEKKRWDLFQIIISKEIKKLFK